MDTIRKYCEILINKAFSIFNGEDFDYTTKR